MVQYIINPWRNHGELLRMRQQLYPSPGKPADNSSRHHAVAQVSVWIQRGNCPHLVESTAILTSAILNDVPGNSAYCVRAAYSAAFCRFVTGLLDGFQNKGRKIGMYSIAKDIGLPATYVELRHQATHEELPSLPKLRAATQKALRWIWDYYWAKLSADLAGTENCQVYVRKLLAEDDEQIREKMEAQLNLWNDDEVLAALADIDDVTDDPAMLMRSLKLFEKIMNASKPETAGEVLTLAPELRTIDEVKAELARMQSDLSDSDDEEPKLQPAIKGPDIGGNGWTLWEGPWLPKPIGSIC